MRAENDPSPETQLLDLQQRVGELEQIALMQRRHNRAANARVDDLQAFFPQAGQQLRIILQATNKAIKAQRWLLLIAVFALSAIVFHLFSHAGAAR